MPKILVELRDRSYDIIIGSGNISKLSTHFKKLGFSSIIVITDTTVDALHGKTLKKALTGYKVSTIRIPPGEKHKNLYTASAIYDQMVKAQVHRDSLVIAFGGGVIGDLAGFVAATYMRGLPVIQVPTTLLAQVDASIGGKTGVDHPGGKNLIGTFYQPKLVFIDVEFIKTLSTREIKTGLAEVIKYGIIKDPQIFDSVENNPKADSDFWVDIVTRCAKIKAEVVSKDEFEKTGLRMILNLGHTFAHAFESLTGYDKYTHGEAVALGLVAASKLSAKLKLLKPSTLVRIEGLISRLKLPTSSSLHVDQVMKALFMDKKVKGDKINFVLPVSIGKVVVKNDVNLKTVKAILKELGCC